MTLTIGALFAGYGGLDLGVMDVLDARVSWYAEFDKAPARIMAHHHPDVPNLWDVTTVDWTAVEPVDVITGGSPCQDLSHAGKRAGMKAGTRSGLWASMCDAVEIIRPRLVVWENVRGAYSAAADSAVEPCPFCVGDEPGVTLRALGRVLGDLAELGYDARWYGLRAADVGAAHGRFRVFVFATPADADVSGLEGRRAGGECADEWAAGPDGVGAGAEGLTLLPTPACNNMARILADRSEEDDAGCFVWTGWTNGAATPYGKFSIGNEKFYAHRAAYEVAYGAIPDGHEVDHLCQNTLCVNPAHLEAVTPKENRDRVMRRRTHCKRGHEFTEENTFWVREGARACRTCRAWQDKVQKARKAGRPEPEAPLLPTPVTNDMGEGKTVEAWDAWTARMKAEHGNGNGHGKSLAIEAQRMAGDVPLFRTPTAQLAVNGGSQHPEKRKVGGHGPTLADEVEHLLPTPTAQDAAEASRWGDYGPAIARWEHVIGRPAPDPTEPGTKGQPRLSPRFVEWMMGLPDGWVTDPAIWHGLTNAKGRTLTGTQLANAARNHQLKALGNGVVWQQCAAALARFLADERAWREAVAA